MGIRMSDAEFLSWVHQRYLARRRRGSFLLAIAAISLCGFVFAFVFVQSRAGGGALGVGVSLGFALGSGVAGATLAVVYALHLLVGPRKDRLLSESFEKESRIK